MNEVESRWCKMVWTAGSVKFDPVPIDLGAKSALVAGVCLIIFSLKSFYKYSPLHPGSDQQVMIPNTIIE